VLAEATKLKPDIIVLDVDMPRGPVVDPTPRALRLFLDETSFTLQNNGHTVMAVPHVRGTLMLEGVIAVLYKIGREDPLHAVLSDGDNTVR
jgi:hypothetical protein